MSVRFFRNESASAAVEFALIVPVLFTAILGTISICALYFSQSAMHTAAEWGARYWAVSDSGWTVSGGAYTAPEGSSATTPPVSATSFTSPYTVSAQNFAKQHYYGTVQTSFTGSTGVCTQSVGTFGGPGFIMTATATYNFNAMFVNFPVSMSTTACYPEIQ
ncbi:MAG TPA: TadE/TadG family type IV pilus assembly protein [Candidatus Sulfopaludibacter sp.]|jgi:Flp pilus assembly protein TadG|nr:TadE/TadG family type IV pilus assembly protein [Candidatus Sulfopaludibacter sp.]